MIKINITPFLKKTIIQFLILILFLTIARIGLYLFNKKLFPPINFLQTINLFLTGIRFDLTAVIYFNIPFLFLSFFSEIFFPYSKLLKTIAGFLFYAIGLLILLANLIDIVYYRFSLQRSSSEIILLAKDSAPIILKSAIAFWYITLCSLVIAITFKFALSKVDSCFDSQESRSLSTEKKIIQGLLYLFTLFFIARGTSTFPLTPSSANLYVNVGLTPVVQNSAYNILSSIRYQDKNPYPDFSNIDTSKISFRAGIQEKKIDPAFLNKKNIIVFLLESFSRSYLEKGSIDKAYTPFLDSLMSKSLVCTNAFSNGTMSINGINSVVGSIPPIAYRTIINTPYENTIRYGIGSYLEKIGYSTYFFYGSDEDHYGFKRLVRQFGISKCYNRKTFGNDKFYDGMWGIYDKPFLEYSAHILNQEKSPFFAFIFNISSHYPFSVPEPYASLLKGGPLNSSKSISYTDLAIRSFFDHVKNEKWFKNSFFIFVADHQSYGDNSSKKSAGINKFGIPLFFYSPDSTIKPAVYSLIADQLDVVPSILDLIHYPYPFLSFGKSLFDSSENQKISYSLLEYPDVLQITNDSMTLHFNIRINKSKGLYFYKTDSLLKINLIDSIKYSGKKQSLEEQSKIFLYNYYKALNTKRNF
jgi:phosphoglycerol transferase MdoB-like AlkP superfamily enzyme